MNIDDSRLTAYALGEVFDGDKAEIETLIQDSPEARHFVDETRDLAEMLKAEYAAADAEEPPKPANLIDIHDDPWFWSKGRPLAIAALIALFAIVAAVSVSSYRRNNAVVASNELIRLPAGPAEEYPLSAGKASPEFLEEVQGELSPEPAAPPMQEHDPVIVTGSHIPSAEQVGPNAVITGNEKAKAPAELVNPFAAPISGGSQARLAKSGNRPSSAADSGTINRAAVHRPDAVAGVVNLQSTQTGEQERYGGYGPLNTQFNTAAYDHILENPFLDAVSNPLSTFSIDVDTASYSNIRRFINTGSLPPKDAVRIEEMVNYFTYDYPQPVEGKPFSINVDIASCPWETSHRLVRIGLKGREVAVDKRGASNLVFLLDVSGSMTPPERLPLVKQAMRLLVEKLTENDRVAIVVYAGGSGLALPSTTGDHKEQILSAIEDLDSGGSTNGAEGIELAYRIAAENFIKGGVNRVILATDGDFNVGVTSQGDLVRLIQEKAKTGVFLSVLGVGTDNLQDSTMQKLADKGNGNYAYLDSLDEARKVLVQQMNGTLVTIAKDVKIQLEFNPARVASYRLIGYEKRMLQKEDFNNDKVDAGEIGAGHTVTALYEVVPVGLGPSPATTVPPVDPLKYSAEKPLAGAQSSNEMLTVKLRHKKPDGDKSELIEQPVVDNGTRFDKASDDFKFAASVAQFGMILRDSEHKGAASLEAVLEWAQGAKGSDPNGYRAGFIDLVRKTQALKKG